MADLTTIESAASAVWSTRDYLYTAGVFVAVISAWIAGYSAYKTGRRDLNSLGDSEIKTFEMIAKAEKDFAEFNARLTDKIDLFDADPANKGKEYPLTGAETGLSDFYTQSVLNAYEIACQRYLDKKLDGERFKKTYRTRLNKICSSLAYNPIIDDGSHNYAALKKVNDIFNNPEK